MSNLAAILSIIASVLAIVVVLIKVLPRLSKIKSKRPEKGVPFQEDLKVEVLVEEIPINADTNQVGHYGQIVMLPKDYALELAKKDAVRIIKRGVK